MCLSLCVSVCGVYVCVYCVSVCGVCVCVLCVCVCVCVWCVCVCVCGVCVSVCVCCVPFIGPDLALLIRGDYVVGDATLNRFFSFHVIAVPLALIGLVAAHLLALHDVGSNSPDGIEIKDGPKGNRWSPDAPADGVPFHPYYSVHDVWAQGQIIFSDRTFLFPVSCSKPAAILFLSTISVDFLK